MSGKETIQPFTIRVVKHWIGAQETVQSPSLQISRTLLGQALTNLIQCQHEQGAKLDGSFKPKFSLNSMVLTDRDVFFQSLLQRPAAH